jgi:O-antigen/teichoic acid export membrane protein
MISSNLFSSILEIDFKYEYLAIIQLINSSLLPIIGIVMAIKGFGVWSLVTIYVLQHIISFGLLWYYSKWAPQFSLNKGLAIDYIRSGYTIMLGRILEVFVVKFDKLFLGYFYLKRDLGFYSRAYNVAETGHYFVSPVIVTMSLPIYSKIKSDKEKMELTLKYVNYLIPRIIYPIVLILSCFSKDFLLLLYGEKWLPAAAPLLMLFPYVLMLPLFENAKSVLFALDRPSLVLRIRFVQSLGLLISLLGLTYLFGWKGAAFSVDISIIAGILLISYYFKSVIKIKLKLASSLALPLSCLALSFVLSWISKGFLQRGFMNMAFQLAVLLMLFYGSVLFFEKKLLKSALSYCIGERFRSRMDKYLGA